MYMLWLWCMNNIYRWLLLSPSMLQLSWFRVRVVECGFVTIVESLVAFVESILCFVSLSYFQHTS